MKPLPKKITKAKMVELYADQMNTKNVLTELQSFQEQLGINKRTKILCNRVKALFFKNFNLPSGYEMQENSRFDY